jgi:hypothetical protein
VTFHITQLAQALAERLETALSSRIRRGTRRQIAYAGRLLPRLGGNCGERRRKEQKDQGGGEPHDRERREVANFN